MEIIIHTGILQISLIIAAIAQVLLKKSALKKHSAPIFDYLNPLVIAGYALLFCTTFITIYAYKVLPLSLGAVLESTSYIYVTILGAKFFNEQINKQKLFSLTLIIIGVMIFSFS